MNLKTVSEYAKTPSSTLLEQKEGENLCFIELYIKIYLTFKITLQGLLRTRKTKHTSLDVKNLVLEVKCLHIVVLCYMHIIQIMCVNT